MTSATLCNVSIIFFMSMTLFWFILYICQVLLATDKYNSRYWRGLNQPPRSWGAPQKPGPYRVKGITFILLSCKGLSSNWLQVKVTKLYWIRNTVIGGYQTYLFQLMPTSRDDFKSVCSFMLNHCLIQKYSSNQSKVYLSLSIHITF